MLLNLCPRPGRDFGPGWVMFSTRRGLLAGPIAAITAAGRYFAGRLVATHCGLVLDHQHVAEALGGGYAISPLAPLLVERDVMIWFRRPGGLTPAAAGVMADQARAWASADVPYDFVGCASEPLAVDLDSPRALFCSEAVAALLRLAEPHLARPLPSALREIPPEKWNPHELDSLDGLWGEEDEDKSEEEEKS